MAWNIIQATAIDGVISEEVIVFSDVLLNFIGRLGQIMTKET